MLFAKELLQYLFKFVILIVIAVVGCVCGANFKKNKIAKQETEPVAVKDEEE